MTPVLTAGGAFLATNVDDVVLLAALFAVQATSGRPPTRVIVAGQVLGFGALVGVSLLAAAGLSLVPPQWLALLGLVPLALGLVALVRARSDDAAPPMATSLTGVAAVTVANGADNISVYTPLFLSGGTGVTVVVFAVGVAVWCALGAWLGRRRIVLRLLSRAGAYAVPIIFIAIGILILVTGLAEWRA